jgi:putative PIN family toxin of toxin-antitoxin system
MSDATRAMRAVLDTNTLVSAMLWGGVPKQVLDIGRDQRLALITSAALVAELEDVLARPKFAARLIRAGTCAAELVEGYLDFVRFVHAPAITPISRDPKDDKVLACAAACAADLLISGDRDLLALGHFRNTRIVSPSTALALVAESGS